MRKSTKKFLSVAMLLALTFSLTACGDKDNSKNTITETTPTTEAGGIQLSQLGMLQQKLKSQSQSQSW